MDLLDELIHRKTPFLERQLKAMGINWDDLHIQLFANKSLQILQLFVKTRQSTCFHFFRKYPFTAFSGTKGPKRKEGDLQIPEGNYFINRFNPKSKYHLSLGINYPNAFDQSLGRTGSDIFIHGGITSKGCLAIGDEAIEEVYLLAHFAALAGQIEIPVTIYSE